MSKCSAWSKFQIHALFYVIETIEYTCVAIFRLNYLTFFWRLITQSSNYVIYKHYNGLIKLLYISDVRSNLNFRRAKAISLPYLHGWLSLGFSWPVKAPRKPGFSNHRMPWELVNSLSPFGKYALRHWRGDDWCCWMLEDCAFRRGIGNHHSW